MTGQTTRTNTKDALRNAARSLFARHGYEGVSMRDIAGAVGVQQSAIYNHFSSKQHLLVDLMVAHMTRVLDDMRGAIAKAKTPAEKLEAFARFHVMDHIDYPEDVFLAFMELRSLEAEGKTSVLPLRDAYEAEIRGILEEGQASGAFDIQDAAVVTRALIAMLTGVTVWFREDGSLDRGAVAETYVQLVFQGVGGAYPRKT